MTAYYQVFLDQGYIAAARALCQGMDEQESALEKVRVRLGFHEDWSPSYDRTQAAPARSDVSWSGKMASVNGPGDLNRLIGELCSGMDIITEKWAEVEAFSNPRYAIAATHPEEDLPAKPGGIIRVSHPGADIIKRSPGRPRKEA